MNLPNPPEGMQFVFYTDICMQMKKHGMLIMRLIVPSLGK